MITDHKETKCVVVEWNYQILNKENWLSFVKTVMNLRIPLNEEAFSKI